MLDIVFRVIFVCSGCMLEYEVNLVFIVWLLVDFLFVFWLLFIFKLCLRKCFDIFECLLLEVIIILCLVNIYLLVVFLL